MTPKYHLVLDWGEASTEKRIPSYIVRELEKHKMCKPEFVGKDHLKIEADYYLIQNLIKDIFREVLDEYTNPSIGYEELDELIGTDRIKRILDICNEDWSFQMRDRWNKMQPEMVDTLRHLAGYRKVRGFLRAMVLHNERGGTKLTSDQIKNLIDMGKYVFDNYVTVKYGEVFEKFNETTTLAFPTAIIW